MNATATDFTFTQSGDDDWHRNSDPELLGDGAARKHEQSELANGNAAEHKSCPMEILVTEKEEPGKTHRLEELESLLPGISQYLGASSEQTNEEPKNVDVLDGSPLHSSSTSDATIKLRVDRNPSPGRAASKQRRPQTIRISSRGQNPQKAWEEKQRRDSAVDSIEKPGIGAENADEHKFEGAGRKAVDFDEKHRSPAARKSSGR